MVRERKVTLQVRDTCSFCGQPVVTLAQAPRPLPHERANKSYRDNCVVTPAWRWCATLHEIDPPDGEAA